MALSTRLIACFSVLWLAAGCGAGETGPAKPFEGEIRLNAAFDADFALVDHTGTPATDERFEGKQMLIYFGFTSCPDVCPAALGLMSAALDELGADADAIQPLFITVDPQRDTPDRLAQHLAFDDRILGLTGDAAALDAARAALKVYAQTVEMPDSAMEYTVDHQSMFFLTDRAGTPIVAIKDTVSPNIAANIIKRTITGN